MRARATAAVLLTVLGGATALAVTTSRADPPVTGEPATVYKTVVETQTVHARYQGRTVRWWAKRAIANRRLELQRAQPVMLAHHLLAYVFMLARDRERFQDCLERVNVMPLGSGALAGTAFPIDREQLARDLGFAAPSPNSMDAVADRDYILEFLSHAAILGMHLSRLSADLTLWATAEFGFVEFSDAFATGSSIMPQKKNPDVAELIRGKTGRLYGNAFAAMVTMKGLPLTYNSDMQEDKEPLFDTVDTL